MASIWHRTLLALGIAGALLAWRLVPGDTAPATIRVSQPLMGTLWTLEVCPGSNPTAATSAIDAAFRELSRIDALMSEWRPESPVSQINAAAGLHPVEVPEELRALIERSILYSQKTEGAFDITWRGMGKIWRFDEEFRPPTAAQVALARKNVNYRDIRINGNQIYLPRAAMSIGLGGIAKGYAVDRAMQLLQQRGFRNVLVDGGGDVRVSGSRNGVPWRLGIQHPRRPRGDMIAMLLPENQALVSSGDYERFRMVDGVRFHHIIDVRTGWPANAAMAVTVLAATAEQGAVLGKGIFILGPEKGLALARSEGVEALLIDSQGRTHTTEGFRSRMMSSGGSTHPEQESNGKW